MMSRIRFKSQEDADNYKKSCNDKCIAENPNDKVCPRNFVDCSAHGGYDPKDRCQQTCLKKADEGQMNNCDSKCKEDVETFSNSNDIQASFNKYNKCKDDCN